MLNFPPITARFSGKEHDNTQVFDIVRKKFVELTPEEWVRQHVIHFLVNQKQYPLSLVGVEQQLKLNNTLKRTDIVVYNKTMSPILLVECKASTVPLTQQVVDQAMRYNIPLQVPYVLLTNGLRHICFRLRENGAEFMNDIPGYENLTI